MNSAGRRKLRRKYKDVLAAARVVLRMERGISGKNVHGDYHWAMAAERNMQEWLKQRGLT